MTSFELDMIQTAGIGALALIVGMVLTRKVAFLQKFCVPSPVSGGIIFSLLTLVLYGWFDVEVSFDGTLKVVFKGIQVLEERSGKNRKWLKISNFPRFATLPKKQEGKDL